ncbi:S-layer homology domain-containing protein [Leptolyngbya subtilissima ST-M1]|uniref:S-layer homology domain-containing protein n=1 Tax=Cyanophyceae TaxID=3028117 RepID=UPI0018F0535F|nr:S-layer homology domain-containing protein [Nodosilinea sp. FACHB-131]
MLTLQPTSAIASPEQPSGQAGYLSDTEGHWAQPFIQSLTAQNLLKGYPDGTFRPDQPVRRDEFAAILSQSFNQVQEDPIADGSVYNDVPVDHWAKDAIEEAHESGFMSGYPGGLFAPDREISRTEALVSLSQNLNLEAPPTLNASDPATPTANNSTAPEQSTANQADTNNQVAVANSTAANQSSPTTQRPRRNTFLMPMALTTLMQPLVAPARARNVPPAANRPAQSPDSASTAAAPNSSAPANTAEAPNRTDRAAGDNAEFEALPSEVVSNYYTDAQKIPIYAVDPIATATQAGLVVNYPDRQLLNPDRPATRAEIAAFIHQALVHQGRLAPLADNPAANYIVDPSQSGQ